MTRTILDVSHFLFAKSHSFSVFNFSGVCVRAHVHACMCVFISLTITNLLPCLSSVFVCSFFYLYFCRVSSSPASCNPELSHSLLGCLLAVLVSQLPPLVESLILPWHVPTSSIILEFACTKVVSLISKLGILTDAQCSVFSFSGTQITDCSACLLCLMLSSWPQITADSHLHRLCHFKNTTMYLVWHRA